VDVHAVPTQKMACAFAFCTCVVAGHGNELQACLRSQQIVLSAASVQADPVQ
jgi:hypothetical protein